VLWVCGYLKARGEEFVSSPSGQKWGFRVHYSSDGSPDTGSRMGGDGQVRRDMVWDGYGSQTVGVCALEDPAHRFTFHGWLWLGMMTGVVVAR